MGEGRLSPHAGRAQGRHGTGIATWISAAMAWVAPRGYLGLVLSSEQVPEALDILTPQFGGICLLPLVGQAGKSTASRCLVFARQGSRSPFQISAPLILRTAEGQMTAQAKGILNAGHALALPPLK